MATVPFIFLIFQHLVRLLCLYWGIQSTTSNNLITPAMLWLRDQTINEKAFKDKSLFEINWNLKLINEKQAFIYDKF
ncbi:hypothetical protein BpHYR1_028480 [Brachionus plicatilis]|uniref:Uncharacterized protein n=1 Tax=Brachionus plicatilis TaxID=10195 RepID=A0A3M7S0F9_BRAPC|nr:hypothetical protein BpHYR1_028480 [Brachionus plicatilis]